MLFIIGKDDKRFDHILQSIKSLDLDKTWTIDIKQYYRGRTKSQNKLFWLWMQEISKAVIDSHGKYITPEDWHNYFCAMFLGYEQTTTRGLVVSVLKSTRGLSTKEFTDLLESIDMYSGGELKIRLSHPGDLFIDAMKN